MCPEGLRSAAGVGLCPEGLRSAAGVGLCPERLSLRTNTTMVMRSALARPDAPHPPIHTHSLLPATAACLADVAALKLACLLQPPARSYSHRHHILLQPPASRPHGVGGGLLQPPPQQRYSPLPCALGLARLLQPPAQLMRQHSVWPARYSPLPRRSGSTAHCMLQPPTRLGDAAAL